MTTYNIYSQNTVTNHKEYFINFEGKRQSYTLEEAKEEVDTLSDAIELGNIQFFYEPVMNHLEKVKLYNQGLYLLPVPPVTTQYWVKKDWIDFIDSCGRWIIK